MELSTDDLAVLASNGDSEALSLLWVAAIPRIRKMARRFTARYPWVDTGDLAQSVLLQFPKIVRRYKWKKARGWERYLSCTIFRATQDELRKEDPLGVKIPQKKRYPAWRRLSDFCALDRGCGDGASESVIIDGYKNLDAGYVADMGPPTEAAIHPDHRS